VFGALEHEVLEQVGEPCVARPFILGSDVIPEVDGHDRTAVVLVQQHVETVGERVLGERDVHGTLPVSMIT
jgi:hypothetical protein